jgi:lysozyme family protein
MTADNWKPSLAAVLKSEGGNDDDPADHGGRTSRGITQREYDAWRREKALPPLDVWKAPQEDIDSIYHDEYWLPWCDLIPIGTDYMFFDMCVNSGPHEAIVLGQRALGITADGRVGPLTREAFRAAESNPVKLISNYANQKESFYRSLHQSKFIKGWLLRNREVLAIALSMIQKGATT